MKHTFEICCVSLALIAVRLAAQSAPPANPAENPSSDVIQLNPFTVEVASISGYTATKTTTGARIAAEIKSLPFTVDVVPVEFFNDFSLFDEDEQLAILPAFSPNESKGDYQLRGIAGSNFLRNGFLRFGITEKTNIERIEVIKGPAAAIYGKTLPGGVVNVISKQAKGRPEYDFEAQVGQDDLYRAELNLTGPLIPRKLNYRVDLSAFHDTGSQRFRENEQENYSGQLAWFPRADTQVTLEYDRAVNFRGARDGVPFARDKQTGQWLGLASDFPRYPRELNTSGPHTWTDVDNHQVDLSLVHRFSRNWTMRVAGNWYDWDLFTVRGRGTYDPDDNILWDIRPDLGYEARDGHAVNADFTGDFATGRLQHKLLVTLDYLSDTRVVGPTYRLNPTIYRTANGFPGTERIPEISVANPVYFQPPLSDYNNRFRWQESANDIIGVFASDRITMLDNRLIMSLGGRWDTVEQTVTDFHVGNKSKTTVDDFTIQSGLNYFINPDVALYGSYSTSFFPQSRLDPQGNPFPNQEGTGVDLGVKLDLLDRKVFVVLNYFNLKYRNIVVQDTDPITGATIFTLNGLTSSKGWELNIGGMVGSLTFKAGVGYVDARIEEDQSAVLVGLQPRRVPTWNLGSALKYDFKRGRIKGAYVGLNTVYNSSARISDSANGTLYRIRSKEWWRHDVTLGYRLPRPEGARARHTVSLTLKNAFDEEYLYGGDPTPGNPRQLIFRYSCQFR